ncbi:RNA polymerase sigma factor RpoD/SigA [bacterium]|nr:RNA polymerase sigma factor RpoD/SigA [bacterium]MBU1071877.1 RNA polymerase sigma factor RpoD/SigA [bacterium]MBU1674783.1 RNA polymerase sigma factor RpoD/SigA [bacterium]
MYEIELSSDRREDASLQHYLQTIGKYKLLTKEEEFELARRIRGGDKDALDHLVNANLRFVVSVAKKFLNQGLSYMDLIAEGNIGLITAAKRFDERRDFRFISYAVWWIRQAIQKAIAEQTNTVRLPINRTQQAQRMKKASRRLEQLHHRKATEEEVAAELGLTLRKMNQIRNASRPLASLDESVFDDESISLAETLADPDEKTPEEYLLTGEMLLEMRQALEKLTPRERSIIIRYYGLGDDEPASLETIGQDIDLSRERVRQIRNQALGRIRHAVSGGRLLDYLN